MFRSLYYMQMPPRGHESRQKRHLKRITPRTMNFSVQRRKYWCPPSSLGAILFAWSNRESRAKMQQQYSTFIHVELCSLLVPVLDAAIVSSETQPRPRLSHRLIMKLPPTVLYFRVQSHLSKQRFLDNEVGDYGEQKNSVVCLFFIFNPFFSCPFFAQKQTWGVVAFSAPGRSLWVYHRIRGLNPDVFGYFLTWH